MLEFFMKYFPNVVEIADEIPQSIQDTLIMLFVPGVISAFFGIILGVILTVTKKGGILQNRIVFNVLDKVVNLFRAIPFVILISLLVDVSRAITGTSIGVKGVLLPLTVGIIPFFARQIESALAEVDAGVIEASESMGCSPFEIITRVYLRESIPGIVRAITITLISLVGLTAIAGAIGAGGLGDLAIRYGYNRYMDDVTYVTVFIILIIITVIQAVGDYIIKKTTH